MPRRHEQGADTSKEQRSIWASRGSRGVCVLVACPRSAICCLPFVANDKLPQITADDRIQPLWLLRVHGKPLHGYAFVTVAALLILGLMAVVLLLSPRAIIATDVSVCRLFELQLHVFHVPYFQIILVFSRIPKHRLGFVQLCASTASTEGDFQKTQTTHFSCWLTMCVSMLSFNPTICG